MWPKPSNTEVWTGRIGAASEYLCPVNPHPAFEQLNRYYDHVYVLSVTAASERRLRFDQRFAGLRYEYFYGADKDRLTIPQLETQNVFSEKNARERHRFGKTLRPGEIACSWSHRMIYEDLLRKGYVRALILEDDAVPDRGALVQLEAALNELPADAELVFWGWGKNGSRGWKGWCKQQLYHVLYALGLLKWDHQIIRNLYARPFSRHLKKAGFHDFTYAYAISSAAAAKLIEMQTPIQYIADNLLAHAVTEERLNAFTAWPKMFLHDEGSAGESNPSYIR
ncbi:MAG: glycosyltransferase family 25 protein [Bacteroidetes bacterium]|nr:glycosyltransferase family 25 protein [Bacteroidota bacterium]